MALTKLLWHYVSPKHDANKKESLNNVHKMNLLDDYIKSAVVVDDKPDEATPLIKALEEKDIFVKSIEYKDGQTHLGIKKHKDILFFDLMLNDNSNQLKSNISTIVKMLSCLPAVSMGAYGMVIWTKHTEHVDRLKKGISEACKAKESEDIENTYDDEEELISVCISNPPLYIVSLDKDKYMYGTNGYQSLAADLETELNKDAAACFQTNWLYSVENAQSYILSKICGMADSYEKQNTQIPYLLYILAKNQTGLKDTSDYPCLTADAYKAFDELLYSELYVQQKNIDLPLFQNDLSCQFEDTEKRQTISAQLNTQLFLDTTALAQEKVIPGNIYFVKDEKSPLVIPDNFADELKKEEIQNCEKKKQHNEKQRKSPNYLEEELKPYIPNCYNIAIELTPPCDFSQGKQKVARLVGGYIFDIPLGCDIKKKTLFKEKKFLPANSSAKEYTIGPIMFKGKVSYAILDFTYFITEQIDEITKGEHYEICLRAKPKLFSDMLQKFSSHAARLGIASIDLLKVK